MKRAFSILFLCWGSLFSQVGPPSLRCLEVLSNGDVLLTWIPPSDPNGQFQEYEIWFNPVSLTGSYTKIGSGITPVSTNTFIHVGAAAGGQTKFYYIVTRFNGGTGTSQSSDTLHTIFLNIFKGTSDLQLIYNNLKSPPLPSSNSSFTITKEYPIGTVKNLAITPSTTYADTIDVCMAKINYRVSLYDNSAVCFSRSNLIVGEYGDSKDPDITQVDSISVLPDGTTVLAWTVPRDKDIIRYYIIEHLPPPTSKNFVIDSVPGRTSTLYTFTSTTALNRALALFVYARDSCLGIGPFDETPSTIYLTCFYQRCAYQTLLSWNAYPGMKKGLKEYWIYYSVNGGTFKRIGKTMQNTFTHQNVDPGSNLCYFIRAVNSDESITSSSNRSCFFSDLAFVPKFIYLSAASVSGKKAIDLRLFIDNSTQVESIEIQRSSDSSHYSMAGTVPYTGEQWYYFTDKDVDPGSRSYYYRALFRDSCGNDRSMSNVAKTVLLKVKEDENRLFTKHLSWSAYSGFAGDVAGYYIYRIVNQQPASNPVGSTGPEARSYTDVLEDEAPKGSDIEYMVQAVEGISNPYGINDRANSNTVPVFMEGTLFIPTAFAPSGVNRTWRPVTHFIDKWEYRLSVFDRWGKLIFETNNDQESWNGDGHPTGVYVYLIRYKNSRGEYKEKTGQVTLLR